MNDLLIYTLIVIGILVFINIFNRISMRNVHAESMVNIDKVNRPIKWARNKKCKYEMSKTLKDILKKTSMSETQKDDWTVYFPCTYNDITQEIKQVSPDKKDQRIFIVNNADEISGKNNIWKNLVSRFGRDGAKQFMPLTYRLDDEDDMKKFKKEYLPTNIYILKKNIQRQEGLLITRDKSKILDAYNQGYVIVQELLQDPYIINTRKINMRFYLLLVCKDNSVDAYVYDNGFMYYTKEPFVFNSDKPGPNITTGYIDRSVYDKNPLTHEDFKKYLDKERDYSDEEIKILASNQKISDVVFSRIYDLLKNIVEGVKHTVCVESHLKKFITFQLFGADVALNDKLIPQLMEVNKGPDTGCKDDRDCHVKKNMVNDILKVIKVVPGKNNFIKIFE